jgi:hypothetical protein
LSYCHGSLGGRKLKIPARPPILAGEEIAELNVQDCGDGLEVVHVERGLSGHAPAHRGLLDSGTPCELGPAHLAAGEENADLLCDVLA